MAIVQQEFELARVELVQKLPATGRALLNLLVAAVVIALGAILIVAAAIWALADYVFGFQHVWAGFATVAAVLLIGGGFLARSVLRRARRAGPPLPVAAARQAQEIRKTMSAS